MLFRSRRVRSTSRPLPFTLRASYAPRHLHALNLGAAFNHASLPARDKLRPATRLVSRTPCRTLLGLTLSSRLSKPNCLCFSFVPSVEGLTPLNQHIGKPPALPDRFQRPERPTQIEPTNAVVVSARRAFTIADIQIRGLTTPAEVVPALRA